MRKAIRRYLKLDTWGMDIFRLKRRMGDVIQTQVEFEYTLDNILDSLDSQAMITEDVVVTMRELVREVLRLRDLVTPGVGMVEETTSLPESDSDIDDEVELS